MTGAQLDLDPGVMGERITAAGFAPLRNITLLHEMIDRLQASPAHLPRIGVLSGPSGFGKSFAAAHASGEFAAYYVEARSTWTRRAMMLAILRQMGIQPAHTVYEMVEQASEQLALSRRPLIVDEMDHVIQRGLVEVVRDLYEQSQSAVALIGEELLPQKLVRFERVHGRILEWVQAAPCNLEDAQALGRLYCGSVQIDDRLLERLVRITHGSTRRVCVNLDRIAAFGRSSGLARIGIAEWADRALHTGEPPKSRLF